MATLKSKPTIYECAMVLPHEEEENMQTLDEKKAFRAASLIVEFRIDLEQRDEHGKTVLHYAEDIKERLPQTYDTIMAGLVKQYYERERRPEDRGEWKTALQFLYYKLAPAKVDMKRLAGRVVDGRFIENTSSSTTN